MLLYDLHIERYEVRIGRKWGHQSITNSRSTTRKRFSCLFREGFVCLTVDFILYHIRFIESMVFRPSFWFWNTFMSAQMILFHSIRLICTYTRLFTWLNCRVFFLSTTISTTSCIPLHRRKGPFGRRIAHYGNKTSSLLGLQSNRWI